MEYKKIIEDIRDAIDWKIAFLEDAREDLHTLCEDFTDEFREAMLGQGVAYMVRIAELKRLKYMINKKMATATV